jgi:two-component system nitrate/nitrite response regulator NarL
MRVILAGTEEDRGRLRAGLNGHVTIVAEFDTLAAARAARLDAAGILVALPDDDAPAPESLTPRERDVLELLAEGLPNKAIAARLGVSDQTVKFHVAALSGKLGAANRTDAVRRAVRQGLISL